MENKQVTCPSCGFTGTESDFTAEVKQEIKGDISYINVGFVCRCGAKWW